MLSIDEMLNASKPHFLEGFDPSTSFEQLKIPSKFIKHMEGKRDGKVLLVGPSGNTWHANLIQQTDSLLVFDGWAAFVKDHFLEHGDSLVFRYHGNLHFSVQIFDQSSCEKEVAFNAECSQDLSSFNRYVEKKRGRESTTFLDSIVEGVPKKMRSSQVSSESITRNQEANLETTVKQGLQQEETASRSEKFQVPSFSSETENCGGPSRNAVTIAMPSLSNIYGENSVAAINNRTSMEDELCSYAQGCMRLMSAPEAERAARSFTSCFPNFTKVMKRFNISGSYTLNIPYQFSMAHLPKCKVQIVLHNLKGESWTVNSIPTTRVQTSHTFCGGWLAFVRDNNINMGDICIFELVGKCELRVQILRVEKEELDYQSGKEAFKGPHNGYLASSHKLSKKLPKKMGENSHKVHLQRITKVQSSYKKKSDSEESTLTKVIQGAAFFSEKNVFLKSSTQHKEGKQTKGCMSMKSAPEEKIAAQSFISSFPHFVRIMKKFNISGSYTLKIPYLFSTEHLPKCRTEIVLRNLKGECWTVNSIPTIKVQILHTFCGGWMAFVRDNDIQMGDICIFELIGKCEMCVHIFGGGMKGLDYLGGKAASNESAVGSLLSNHALL